MASLKEMRNRIASVKATQKITKAMQMVAAAKLRRSQDAAEGARPYAQRMASVIANLTPLVSLQLQGLNLNNEIFGFFQGAPGARYSIQRETYGRSFILGVKYGFGGR